MKDSWKDDCAAPNQSISQHPLFNLSLVPLVLVAWMEGKKVRPLLAEIFGLSTGRFRAGKSWDIRESTIAKANARNLKQIQDAALKNGGTAAGADSLIQSFPSRRTGQPQPFGDLIYLLELAGNVKMPLSIAFAEEVDRFSESLLSAYKRDDLATFKEAVVNCPWGEGIPRSREAQEYTDRRLKAFKKASTWAEALELTAGFVDNLVVCLFAALDAEHGATYFGHFQARPIFLLVAPKFNATFDAEKLDRLPKRNLVYHPSRRLMELSHAMLYLARRKKWPAKPVGPKDLGLALRESEKSIEKIFDGTRKLTLNRFVSFWIRMRESGAEKDLYLPPILMAFAGIVWENLLIARDGKQKLRRIVTLDDDNYLRFWTWHRHRWAGHLREGNEAWPAWLDD